jgi:hypothetical protein
MLPTLNKHGDAVCAWCNRMHRNKGWFCSVECDDEEMARRVGLTRLLYAIRDAARAARSTIA